MTQKSPPDFSDASQWKEVRYCPLCGQGGFRPVVQAPDRHYGNRGLFQIVECVTCGLNFLNPMPTVDYLSGAYPTDYYAYQPATPEPRKSRILNSVKRVLRPDTTGDPRFEKPGAVLDIGCGSGTFLAAMRERGWQVQGVEFDNLAAERGRQEGLDIFAGTIDAAKYPSSTFDYVRSNHSFEHVHNPREVLLEIRRIVKPTGLLFIGVPNVKGLMARLYGTYWWYLGAPVHPFGYSPATLGRLLAETGFKIERVNYNSKYAGVVGSIQLYLNRNNARVGDDGQIARNRFLRLIGHWAARLTDLLRMGDCIEVIARPI
ncbi:MAG: class I SAM-dependent methyltransferase [Terriglobales bacterium]|jgi:SAM-dependent methyltransferase